MAKTIYVCFREKVPPDARQKINEICLRLEPDNIKPPSPMVFTDGNIACGIMNPAAYLQIRGGSLLMGQLYGSYDEWDVPYSEIPDGSYGIFRDSKDYCELVADPAGSRSIWYYMDDDRLVASTSQRAVIMFLGEVSFNDMVIPWMFSTGTHGPLLSWDRRIRCLPPDSSIVLDKMNWKLHYRVNKIEFNPVTRPEKDHEELLKKSIRETIETVKINYSSWVLPLSGGYDSRGILCHLKEAKADLERLKTITWGLTTSLNISGNDATVARELAKKLNVSNTYYPYDFTDEPVEKIIDRFVNLGEARIDHFSDYLDGFKMWKKIHEDGIEGIIRGDEAFGEPACWAPLIVRRIEGCLLCSDLDNLKDYRKYGLPLQELPTNLCRKEGESLSTWRDRIFHVHILPVDYAALSDLKYSYVEQINPLLSRRILQQVRELPDELRTGKSLFKKIVSSMSPDVDFAKSQSSTSEKEVLQQERITELVKRELTSAKTKKLFSTEFLDFVLGGIKSKNQLEKVNVMATTPRKFISNKLPVFIKRALVEKIVHPSIDYNILAFRVLLVTKMHRLLEEDSRVLTVAGKKVKV